MEVSSTVVNIKATASLQWNIQLHDMGLLHLIAVMLHKVVPISELLVHIQQSNL